MSHASKLLLLSCLTCAFACTVPTLEELDKERPIEKCSAEHNTCAPDAVCFQDRCIRFEGLDCKPGDRRPCGSSVGECRPGTELCGAEGIYGACEEAVTPVLERCDDKDNDCDGWADTLIAPLALTRIHDSGTAAAAIAVRRSAEDIYGTLLTLSSEEGKLVSRTLASDGTWTLGKVIGNPLMEFKMPTLAAYGDTVAAAWLAVRPGQQPGTSNYMVLLTLLDGAGVPITNQVLEIPHVEPMDPNVQVSHLRLAINKTHVLVLIMAANQSFVVTVSRNLDSASRRGPLRLGGVNQIQNRPLDRWFNAAVTGTADRFLVAYEDYSINPTNASVSYYNYTAIISNEGEVVGSAKLIGKDMYAHSPFIHPVQGDPWKYSVYYAEPGYEPLTPTVTRISGRLCHELSCDNPEAFAFFGHVVHRMQLLARPGAQKPEISLYKWQDSRTQPISLTSVTYTDKDDWETSLQPRGEPTFSESLIVMPDSTRYLVYNQPPPPPSTVSSLAVGFSVSEAHVLPFCSP